jgi:hypothetical protein
MAKRSPTTASLDPLAGRIENPTHRVRWWRFAEHDEYKRPRGHHRDCRSAAEAETVKAELRRRHGDSTRVLITIECLIKPCPQCHPQLPGAGDYPWKAERPA